MTTLSSKSTESSILNLLNTNTYICDFEILVKGFKSSAVVDLVCSNFYNIGSYISSRNIAGRRFERALGTKTLNLQLEAQDALFSLKTTVTVSL